MPNLSQFAVILYTIRDHLKTREEVLRSFDRIAEIGYRSIQVSGMGPGLFTEEELVSVTRERGLTICATHEPSDKIRQDPQGCIERLKRLGVRYTAYPFPANVDMADPASVGCLIRDLDEAGRQFADAGLVLCYHNHAHEFFRQGGRTVLERIYAETDPAHLQGELDTFWVQAGGGAPLDWIARLPGRLPLLHLKDYRVTAEGNREFAEIGQGNLDFPAIVEAAEQAGCQHYIVEQDRCPGCPFEAIRTSFAYIRDHLATG